MAEGRVGDLASVSPGAEARRLAAELGKEPEMVELILAESREVLRAEGGVLITETHHGFVCANAGDDTSNLPEEGTACLLPEDPDASARRIRTEITAALDERLVKLHPASPIDGPNHRSKRIDPAAFENEVLADHGQVRAFQAGTGPRHFDQADRLAAVERLDGGGKTDVGARFGPPSAKLGIVGSRRQAPIRLNGLHSSGVSDFP